MRNPVVARIASRPCGFLAGPPCSVVRVALGLPGVRCCFPCYVRGRELRRQVVAGALLGLAAGALAALLGGCHV